MPYILQVPTLHRKGPRPKFNWHDRRARLRTLQPGDKVLVAGDDAHAREAPAGPAAKCHGPCTVEQQLGPVDYVICTPDCRNTKRFCRVNLLKPYHERDPELDPVVTSIPADVLVQSPAMEEMECPAPTSLPTSIPVVETLLSKADDQLTSTQTEDLTALLDEFGDVFCDERAHAPGPLRAVFSLFSRFV